MNNLKEVRENKKMTQEELGDVLGLSQETISQYEAGTRTPNIHMAKKIAEFFGVKVEDIF